MKVRCRNNQNSTLDTSSGLYSSDSTIVLDLEVGREYLVYAVGSDNQGLVYYLCGLNYTYYPHWYPASLFEITDGQLSHYWECAVVTSPAKHTTELILAYRDWAINPSRYYWDLTEHESQALQIWKKHKELIEVESLASERHSNNR